jgi:hypothetical protein
MNPTTRILVFFLLPLSLLWPSIAAAKSEPWRLDAALGIQDRLSLRFEHRLRYEWLGDQFRPLPQNDDDILVLRTLVHARLEIIDALTLGAELQDSRALAGEDRGFINTTVVNAVELLRAYAELGLDDVGRGRLEARMGRITMDVGSRRLVARNRYRNTINAFTGLDAEWRTEAGHALRAFWTLPIQRLPTRPADLRKNRIEFDHEGVEVQFWGLVGATKLPGAWKGQLHFFGLHEDDTALRATRNRQLYTAGLWILRDPKPGRLDFEIESALQFGRSRLLASSLENLDHLAHFQHLEAGYTFDAPWSPRVAIEYDYASGDDDPNDGRNERFDTLFGARRFDFGPTGIYGPFARANLNTPGLRVAARPASWLDGFLAFRAYWLASRRDAWVTTGLRDTTGASGSYVGSQIELRLRATLLSGNVGVEGGYAHLLAGEFMKNAPGTPDRGDADYVYVQLVLRY